jgi:hypothetical protein
MPRFEKLTVLLARGLGPDATISSPSIRSSAMLRWALPLSAEDSLSTPLAHARPLERAVWNRYTVFFAAAGFVFLVAVGRGAAACFWCSSIHWLARPPWCSRLSWPCGPIGVDDPSIRQQKTPRQVSKPDAAYHL